MTEPIYEYKTCNIHNRDSCPDEMDVKDGWELVRIDTVSRNTIEYIALLRKVKIK